MGLIFGARKTIANRIPNILPQNYENCLFPWTFNVVPVNVIYFEVDDGESWIFASRFTRSVCFEFEFGPIFTYATNATISMIRIWHHKQFNCCVPTVLVAFAIGFAEFSVFICCWIVISIHRELWYEWTDEHGDDAEADKNHTLCSRLNLPFVFKLTMNYKRAPVTHAPCTYCGCGCHTISKPHFRLSQFRM